MIPYLTRKWVYRFMVCWYKDAPEDQNTLNLDLYLSQPGLNTKLNLTCI